MPPYHSSFNNAQSKQVCGMAILPLKTKHKGPAPPQRDTASADIIDEALDFFKANIMFRNYEVKGPADRVLIYLTLYAHQCLCRMKQMDKSGSQGAMYQLAIENFVIPGDKAFPLGGLVPNPKNRAEADACRTYFTQLRHEMGERIVERVYQDNAAKPSKWWVCWTKRKFLNMAL
eukprot:TRINITY_DN14917_c0_g1_i1.p2 TRINITY_DN14917_c0_g1~~TRINITY_DN14917_c0_g1_i1.p2  ORF type:complete len:175 (+),score=45.01 TRINITY_DN14917_c0_g1_i1:28-552(+)